mgnify:FL=1|tara:strand:+ start:1214 stop:1927 length:714 start_codon:yes stop_codon:yes gene_type:complete
MSDLKKFLLITPSYKRPYMLRSCIADAINQDYKNFYHSIAVYHDNTEYDYTPLYDDLLPKCLDKHGKCNTQIKYNKVGDQHENYTNAIKYVSNEIGETIDYIVKWDDDDIHTADYLNTINDVINANPTYNIYSFKLQTQLNNYHLRNGDYHNLGGMPEYVGMPNTLIFDKVAAKYILQLRSNSEKYNYFRKKYPGHEDTVWVNLWDQMGLRFYLGTVDSFIWNIHGGNISIGNWVEN